jgi:hypothetical protein
VAPIPLCPSKVVGAQRSSIPLRRSGFESGLLLRKPLCDELGGLQGPELRVRSFPVADAFKQVGGGREIPDIGRAWLCVYGIDASLRCRGRLMITLNMMRNLMVVAIASMRF